jgi:UDP:flavonoid glycosyltransferase YjiC (YdhE family)
VVLGTGFSLPPDVSPLPDLCPWMGPPAVTPERHENSVLDRVNKLLLADGLVPLDRLSQLYADVDDAFLLTFRELDHHANRGPAEYLGSWTPSAGIEPEWPSGSGPHVFAYLKSAASPLLLERALAVLRELPVKTLAYVPRASKNILSMQSLSLRISCEPVNISAALRQCDLALLNGTAGTATQFLLAGVPVVMLPLYLEQIIFSRRVLELGAGLMCAPHRIELLAGRIWHALQDDRFRRPARSFADRYAAYDPLATQHQIADRIEALLEATAKCFGREKPVVQTYV